jgi:hypothetical protein
MVVAEHTPGERYVRLLVPVGQMLAGGVEQETAVPVHVPLAAPVQWSPVVHATPSLQLVAVDAPLQAVVLVEVVHTWQTLPGLVAPLA